MSLETVHTFAKINGGLLFFKRVDIHRVDQVAVLSLFDTGVDAEAIGTRICAALNAELVSRGSKQSG